MRRLTLLALVLCICVFCPLFSNGQTDAKTEKKTPKKAAIDTGKKPAAKSGADATKPDNAGQKDNAGKKGAGKNEKTAKKDDAGKKDDQENAGGSTKQSKSVAEECTDDTSKDPVKITHVERTDPATECPAAHKTCTVLSKTIEVTVQNVCRYLADHAKPGSDKPKREDLILFLDKRPLKEVKAASVSRGKDANNTETEVFRIELTPKPKNDNQRTEWAHVVLKAYRGEDEKDKKIKVSLGLPESDPIPSEETITLMVPYWTWPAIGAMFALGVLMVLIAWKTALVRDGNKDSSFSLAKCQMAWWFYLIICAWVCSAALMLSPTTITNSALVLMGISAATGLSAAAIDKGQRSTKAVSSGNPASKFLDNLLADKDGNVTIHRFQMFAWTVVLGIYFIYCVLTTMVLPEFDNNLLILMGISSGTYIGVKTRE